MTPKRFHYIFIGGLVVFGLVVVTVAYGFFLGVLHASDNLIVANNSDDQLEQRISALQKLSSAIQTTNQPLQVLNQAIPKSRDIPGLVADLESAGNASGVTITDLDFSATAVPTPAPAPTAGAKPVGAATTPVTPTAGAVAAKPAGPTPIPFKMEVIGSYAQMTTFIDRLQHLPRYLDMSQFSLVKPHKEADSVDITFEANAYAQ
jgi:Tfp pilus assembly protein PilO